MKRITTVILLLLVTALMVSCMNRNNAPANANTQTSDTTEPARTETTTDSGNATVTDSAQTSQNGEEGQTSTNGQTADVEGYLSAIDVSTVEGRIKKAYLSENRELIESGDADLIEIDVVYTENGAAAFFVNGMSSPAMPSYEKAADHYFIYNQARFLLVYSDDRISHINTAYDSGIISGETLEKIYIEYRAKNPSIYEEFDRSGMSALGDSTDITYKGQ